jgi:Bacterial PH domain
MRAFSSKRDGWLTVILAGTFVILVAALVPLLMRMTDPRSWTGIAIGLAMLALLASVSFGTRYVVDGGALRIRCGPFRWTIALADVVDVSPTDDPSSAPALSLDRLLIRYRRGAEIREILVSPEDREGFVAAVSAPR